MIIARVDLRIVVETTNQLDVELSRIQKRDRNHVIGWQEDYFENGRKPQGKLDREAVLVVTGKLAAREARR